MTVCSRCSTFGSDDWDPRKPKGKIRRRRKSNPSLQKPRSEIDIAEQMELIDNYGMLIKKARQKKKMTVEDFAKKINEKESVVKKMEKSQMNPPSNLIKKIERELGIKLMEASTPTKVQVFGRPSRRRTIGDVIKIKIPEEEDE
jgi:putative transcription factor